MVVEAERPETGPFRLVGMPIKLSATPARLRHAPPTVGEHNSDILASCGLAAEEIAQLREDGVICGETDRQRKAGIVAWGSDPALGVTRA